MIPIKSSIPIKIMTGNKRITFFLSLFGKKLSAFWNNRKLSINFYSLSILCSAYALLYIGEVYYNRD
jgi:hypothetical protein